jgi:hypothetical protein
LPMVHRRHNLSVIGMALEIVEQMRVMSSFFAKQRVAAESSHQHQDAVVTSTPRCSSNIRGGLRTRRCRTRKSWCRSRRKQCGLDVDICYDESEAAKMLVQSWWRRSAPVGRMEDNQRKQTRANSSTATHKFASSDRAPPALDIKTEATAET